MTISMSASSTTVPQLNTCDVPTTGLRFPPSSRIFGGGGGGRGVSFASWPRNASFVVVKIDMEKYPSSADKYRIEALTTFILFKLGIPFDRFEGAPTANQFIQRIEDSLKVKR